MYLNLPICDVLKISKLQSYRVDRVKQPVAASYIFEPVCEKYASLCDLMDVTLVVDEKIRSLPELLTDKTSLPVVLDALLSNAVKFAPEGGRIQISAQVARKRAVICIRDNGKGISKEELPHIFERFYKGRRGDNETGSGLGLAIAKEIMDGMKEKLWICSKEGVGTAAYFTVTLRHSFQRRTGQA